jgi:hypothetical protein
MEDMSKLISKSPSKSCQLDPISTWLLKECLPELVTIITEIVNKSLINGVFPETFKLALLLPLLKKIILDFEIFNNFRPVSNLSFVSKILEKAVAVQIDIHCDVNELWEPLQSAYRMGHSTETALLKVHSDIMEALDSGSVAVLLLIDLSAAFDTIDHSILLQRLENVFGITGIALLWIKSYLSSRQQQVIINGSRSTPAQLNYGVPQGSVLGPKLFTMYTQPLGELIRKHHLSVHFYADDTQIYITFRPQCRQSQQEALLKLMDCVKSIRIWMASNMLKLNDNKTEVLLVSSKFKPLVGTLHEFNISVGDATVEPQTSVHNLGVIFDRHMVFDKHINNICRTAYMHIRNIGRIRRYITQDTTRSLVQSIIMSRLDYCNSLLINIPATLTNKLQRVQNICARLITGAKRHEEITPVLCDLHWLPIVRRSQYKLLVYVYKAIHRTAPKYLTDMLDIYQPSRSLRSETKMYIRPVTVKNVTYGERQFGWCAAMLWNNLPQHIKESLSISIYKKSLKTHFFLLEYNDI